MKKAIIGLGLFYFMITVGWFGCTSLSDIEDQISDAPLTNMVYVTNSAPAITNLVWVTNVQRITDTVYKTNFFLATNIIWTSTNFLSKGSVYQPIPDTIHIYVDSGGKDSWVNPMMYYWNDYGDANLTKLSNMDDGYVDWWVFEMSGMDLREQFGLKLNDDNWASQEPIKSENGDKYDRIVTWPILTKQENVVITESYTNTNTWQISTTNVITTSWSTYDKIFVYPPNSWYESYIYLFENETNLFADPADGSSMLWDQYMGANYWGSGITFFTFYAPNVRRVWVVGDFSGWQEVPLQLSTGKVFWWGVLSNTSPGDAYKFVIEKYEWTNHHFVSDPFAKKNEYTPAMDTDGNKSYIIDQSQYQWSDGDWRRPDFTWYIIYQMHMRTFETNGPGDWWGWGTFTTATNKFDYIKDLGFTAIEPLPIHEFAGDMSWGYNYTLFYAPETAYTASVDSVEPFKVFVDTAHQKGLAVIIDLVFNHMGASDDVLGAIDPAVDWNNPQTYWYSGKTDWGPKFNYANPVVRKYLTDSAVYLAQNYHVDGFRFDATYFIHYNNPLSDGGGFIYNMTRDIQSRANGLGVDGNILLTAENLPSDGWITGDGGFHFQWNADSAHELKKLFTDGPSAISASHIGSIISGDSWVQYMTSHDEVANGKQRTAADLHYGRGWGDSEYDAQCQQITGLATVLMSKGIPMMFMGDEQLEGFYCDDYWGAPYNARYFTDSVPLSWNNYLWDRDDGLPGRVGAARTAAAVQALAWIRKDNPAIQFYEINVHKTDDVNKVIGFTRGGNINVIINYNKQAQYNYYLYFPDGTWNLTFAHPSGAYGYDFFDGSLTGTVYSGGGDCGVNIPEYGVLIYKKD